MGWRRFASATADSKEIGGGPSPPLKTESHYDPGECYLPGVFLAGQVARWSFTIVFAVDLRFRFAAR